MTTQGVRYPTRDLVAQPLPNVEPDGQHGEVGGAARAVEAVDLRHGRRLAVAQELGMEATPELKAATGRARGEPREGSLREGVADGGEQLRGDARHVARHTRHLGPLEDIISAKL